jgi:hypothetical protein
VRDARFSQVYQLKEFDDQVQVAIREKEGDVVFGRILKDCLEEGADRFQVDPVGSDGSVFASEKRLG